MAENKILPFAINDTGSNLLTDAEYLEDEQRLNGNQPGIARSALVNKVLKQSSLMAAALAQYLADNSGVELNDEMSVNELVALLLQSQRTPGEVGMFCFATPPKGWLLADGSQVSRTAYIKLFNAIGTTFGSGNGNSTFHLPDLRGEFIRGWSANRSDVDVGRVFGSWQAASEVGEYVGHHISKPGMFVQVNNADTIRTVSPFGTYSGTNLVGNTNTLYTVKPRNRALAMFIFAGNQV